MRARHLLHRCLPLSAGAGTAVVIVSKDDPTIEKRRSYLRRSLSQCQQHVVKCAEAPAPSRAVSRQVSEMSNDALTSLLPQNRPSLVQSTDEIYFCIKNKSETFDSIYELSAESLDITREAAGLTSRVFLAESRKYGYKRAVKVVRKRPEDSQDEVLPEIAALTQLDHPHIVKLLRYYDEGPYLYLIFELCRGPDLHTRIRSLMEAGVVMSEQEAALALRHMLKALRCCHSLFMGHYNIKPEHFMYKCDDLTCLKMIDLGMCSDFRKSNITSQGTADYMAPEVSHGLYGPEADVWSCGIVLFTMLTGHNFLPANATTEVKTNLIRSAAWVRHRIQWAKEQRNLSPEALELLRGMLSYDRHLRMDVEQALEHDFIKAAGCRMDDDNAEQQRADELMRTLVDRFREFSKEPLIKRTACLLMAHLVGYEDHMSSEHLAFRCLDEASRGQISVQVIEDYLERKGFHIPDDLDEIFRIVDISADGYIGFVEFLSATLPKSMRSDKERCRDVFRILDRNQDGFIDVLDLCRAFPSDEDEAFEICSDAIDEVGGKKLSFDALYALMCQ